MCGYDAHIVPTDGANLGQCVKVQYLINTEIGVILLSDTGSRYDKEVRMCLLGLQWKPETRRLVFKRL